MSGRERRRGGPYERALERALARSVRLIDPEEEVRAATIVQRGLKPRFALVLMGLGAGLFVSASGSTETLLPEAVRWFVGLPLFVAGTVLRAVPGQALVVLTRGTAYVISRPPLPSLSPQPLADAPARTLEVDLERESVTVGGHRLWALPRRSSSLRPLAAAVPDAPPLPEAPQRSLGRSILASAVLGLVAVALILDAAIETDAEEVERVFEQYHRDLFAGRGEGACAALSAAARTQIVQQATVARAERLDPATCAAAVESFGDLRGEATPTEIPDVGDVEVDGDEATVRTGASFAFQHVPVVREAGTWRLTTLWAPVTVRDAPPDDPPGVSDFALRAEGVCRNTLSTYVPAAARFVTTGDVRRAGPDMRRLAASDRALADDLSALTPPAGMGEEVERIADALREFATARDGVSLALRTSDPERAETLLRSLGPARRLPQRAARDAGLETALARCL